MDRETRSMLLETAGRLFADKSTKDVVNGLEKGQWPEALWQSVEEMGLPSVAVSESAGGAGGALSDLLALAKLAAYYALPLPLVDTAMAAMLLDLAGLAQPGGPMALVVAGPSTSLRFASGGQNVSGSVRNVAFASMVPNLLVLASGQDGKVRVALVPAGAAAIDKKRGHSGEPSDTVAFDSAPVSGSAVVDLKPLRGFELGAAARTSQMAGAAKRILDLAVTYAKERVQFGRPIGNFQAIQQLLAELASYVAAISAAADAAARDAEEGGAFSIAAAKTQAAGIAHKVAGIAHQCMGAMGFTQEHVLHHYTRRLWVWRSDFGSDVYWARRLGEEIVKGGSDALWPTLIESKFAA